MLLVLSLNLTNPYQSEPRKGGKSELKLKKTGFETEPDECVKGLRGWTRCSRAEGNISIIDIFIFYWEECQKIAKSGRSCSSLFISIMADVISTISTISSTTTTTTTIFLNVCCSHILVLHHRSLDQPWQMRRVLGKQFCHFKFIFVLFWNAYFGGSVNACKMLFPNEFLCVNTLKDPETIVLF